MSRIIDEFRGLAWSEVKPKHLDHEYCQILLIGEHLEKGVEPTTKGKKHDKETPQEELEKLEHEDELRVQHLHGKHTHVFWVLHMFSVVSICHLQEARYVEDREAPVSFGQFTNELSGDDSVFDDLKISKQDYPKVPTTW
jgi:hypothetical protein